MGGTPKAALIELGAPTNPRLLVRDGLHAKIYVSDRGAVIGSANASKNGLGFVPGDSGRLIEAGTFYPAGTPAYRAASAAVDELIDAAKPVDSNDVDRAPERSHEPSPPPPATELSRLPLLSLLRNTPGEFADLSVAVVTDTDIEVEKAEAALQDYQAKAGGYLGTVIVQSDGTKVIESLRRNVLLFYMPGSVRSHWSVTLYLHTLLLPPERPEFAFGFAGSHRASGKLRVLIYGKKLSEADWDTVFRVSELDPDTWAYTPEGFSDALARAAAL